MVFVPIEAPLGYREKKTGLHLFKRVFSRLLAGQPDAKPQILPLLPHHGFLFSNLLPGLLQCLHNFCFRIAVNRFHSGGKLRRTAFIGFLPVYSPGIPKPCPLSFGFTPSPPLVILSHISRDNLPCGLIYCLFVIRFSSSSFRCRPRARVLYTCVCVLHIHNYIFIYLPRKERQPRQPARFFRFTLRFFGVAVIVNLAATAATRLVPIAFFRQP